MTSYLVKPGQQKDSPIRYTPPWNETELVELEKLYQSPTDSGQGPELERTIFPAQSTL